MLHSNFKAVYDYDNERVTVLEQVSYQRRLLNSAGCLQESTTTVVGLSIDGIMTDITVSHANCSGNIPPHFIPCENVDLALSTDCPRMGSVLDGSVASSLKLGDSVIAYGFGVISTWKGLLVRNYRSKEQSNIGHNALEGIGNVPSDSFVMAGDPVKGMSGAAVLNHEGLVGIAVNYPVDRFITVVSMNQVSKCVVQHRAVLKRNDECKRNVVKAPVALGVYDTFVRLSKLPGVFLALGSSVCCIFAYIVYLCVHFITR